MESVIEKTNTKTCFKCGEIILGRRKKEQITGRYYCSRKCTRIPLLERFWKNVNKTNSCWLWTACKKGDYGKIKEGKDGTPMFAVHRFSWELHNGKIPKGMLVCHKCDVKNCVNPDHLFIGTYRDNIRDAMNKGIFRITVLKNGGRT